DRIPVDPDHRLAVHGAVRRGADAGDRGTGDAQPAGGGRERGVRAVDAQRVPAGGVDRVVRVQGGADAGGDRGRADRGGRVRDAGPGGGGRGPGAGGRRLDQLGGAPGGGRPRGFLGGVRRGGGGL